jgi:hypothetical protein
MRRQHARGGRVGIPAEGADGAEHVPKNLRIARDCRRTKGGDAIFRQAPGDGGDGSGAVESVDPFQAMHVNVDHPRQNDVAMKIDGLRTAPAAIADVDDAAVIHNDCRGAVHTIGQYEIRP